MVNTGRPSTGCLTCRRRRVKCDEAKPNCQRCVKLKADCQWQDEWSTMLRRQEKWAAKKVGQRVERVQMKRKVERMRAQSTSPLPSAMLPAMLPRQVQIGPEAFAVSLFYADYSFTAATCPFLYLVQPLYEQQDGPDCLHSVVPAVALASAAKQMRRQDLMAAAHDHYGTALRRLVKCLSDPDVAKQDATLITVFLLGLYEFIAADCFSERPTPYYTHGPGRAAILRMRGREQFETRDGRNMFIIMYHEQLVSSLLGNGEPLDESPFWLHDACDLSPVISLQLFMHDTACFVSRCRTGLREWKSGSALFASLLRSGLSLLRLAVSLLHLYQTGTINENDTIKHYAHGDPRRVYAPTNINRQVPKPREFRADPSIPDEVMHKCLLIWWPKDYSIAKVAEKVAKDSQPSADSTPKSDDIDFYLSVTRALASNICRATYIHLLQSLLEISAHVSSAEEIPGLNSESDDKAFQMEWRSAIKQLTIGICEDIPYALGELDGHGTRVPIALAGSSFRAYLQLYPLLTGLNATQDSPDCQMLVKERLTYIGEVLGIGMANQMATMAHITTDFESQRTPTPEFYDFSSSPSSSNDSPPQLSVTPSLEHMRPVQIAIR
ncbi:hypothetical protein EJ04DRAFT_513699 [Polyplosphaeria fusca]|uniref:Zn(2)-C6 fungal-type domain-containing protein n=1 Tax=Polyplosphaeria fusca TaxID=682080 RepID=A0A9P4QRZ3_9PLEO|nr:hypothetical protein EJ04DRAFT_513699 [Polyplosphaeria fusca]